MAISYYRRLVPRVRLPMVTGATSQNNRPSKGKCFYDFGLGSIGRRSDELIRAASTP